MKRFIMVVLPCIIIIALVWGYVPTAREFAGKVQSIASSFKIENFTNTLFQKNVEVQKNDKQESKQSSYTPSGIVDNDKSTTQSSKESTDSKSSVYRIARQYNGKLGIFMPQTPLVPEFIIDVDISSLPPEDRKMFEQGLLINSKTQLANLIEDYTS